MEQNNSLDHQKTLSYDYNLPSELIANYPAKPADEAKLLVFNTKANSIIHTTFKHLLEYIPKDSEIFFNDTKVIKARIFGHKQTGGKIELLFNKPLLNNTYLVYMRGKVLVDNIITFEDNLTARILMLHDDGTRVVKFYKNKNELDFSSLITILNDIGHLPLPPYIKRADEESDSTNYQTLFAKNYGAVAAPTASLHFTDQLLNDLKNRYNTNYLTLHVGAGTFKPVETEYILDHPMHSEYFQIPTTSKTILDSKKKILAVGTTVTRTIEFYNENKKMNGEANIFLNPSNKPKRVDYLLTNFHLPKSTLIMLVASFIGLEKTMEIYETAIREKYRFFSYGDAMLIV
jgi:S-adenosylmethionine:tRNA ribosyltransferase-isomerase